MSKPLKVLIVDDQGTDISGPYHLSRHLGWEATVAFDGQQAFREMKHQRFSLIILDWNMPVMSGAEFLLHLEKLQFAGQQKIVLHTGNDLQFDADLFERAQQFAIVDFWRKPLSPVDMLKRMKRLQEARRA